MFTGIVQTIGKITNIRPTQKGLDIEVESAELAPMIKIDDSVAINGTCQTAVAVNGSKFTVQAVQTTLDKTTFEFFRRGDEVNLELALRPSDRMGGHWVQGHVTSKGQIQAMIPQGESYLLQIKFEERERKYIVKEGSITIDGISLTVADVEGTALTIAIIPHTISHTVLRNRKPGDWVNIEVDILGKYVENLIKYGKSEQQKPQMTEEWIRSKGF